MKASALTLILAFMTLSAQAGGGGGGAHRDNSALFPQPQPNLSLSTPPEAVEILEPAFQASVPPGSVTLSWKPSERADFYHVQVATEPTFKWLKADERWVKEPSFQVKDLENGKTYYWRVAPWNSQNMATYNKGTFSPSIFKTE